MEALLDLLQADPRLAALDVKSSTVDHQIFHRFKVRLKREIVTMGVPAVAPSAGTGVAVAAGRWNALLEDPGHPGDRHPQRLRGGPGQFRRCHRSRHRQLPGLSRLGGGSACGPWWRSADPRRLALFCTGGIRCEKATAYLLEQGFDGVHQLQGGILRYLEQVPEAVSRWRGECYVFDQRVALDHRLAPGRHSLCHACGLPLTPADRALESHVEGVSCRHCIGRFSAADRDRFAERQRQMVLAAARGDRHIGRTMPPPLT